MRLLPRTSLRTALAGLVGLTSIVCAAESAAHGRFPQSGQVVVDPSDEARIFVRTTYGATLTRDRGATWYWVCPESIDFNSDKEDPPVVMMADGTVVAGTFGGLSISHDFGCDFAREGGDLEGRFFVDVQTMQDDHAGVAISSNGLASFAFEVNLWETNDDAASWARFGTAPPADFLALSLGLAWSDADRIYLTGRDGTSEAELEGVLFRTDDRGQTWQRLSVPNTTTATPDEQILPYIGGVAPDDPDTVYVGVITTEGDNVVTHFELLVSSDGAETWTSVFEADDEVSGFALSPDGSMVAVGGPKEGLWTAPTATHAFTKVNELRVGCLTWDASGLFACADEFVDGYSLGVSVDDGVTFSPLARLGSPCGPPPECGAETSTAAECTSRWPQEKAELNADECGGEGGAGGGTSSGASSSGSCGCRVPAPETSSGEGGRYAALLAGLLGLAGVAARRRSKR